MSLYNSCLLYTSYPEISRLMHRGEVVPVCPEVLGGLSIPRPAAEIIGGSGIYVLRGLARVLNVEGVDVRCV